MFYKIHGVKVLIYYKGKLLILKRADSDKYDANLWDVPGGKIEKGENIYEAVKREIFEETGIKPSAIVIKNLLGFIFGKLGLKNKLIIAVFVCQSKTAKIRLNLEHSEYQWIKPKQLSSYKLGRVIKRIQHLL